MTAVKAMAIVTLVTIVFGLAIVGAAMYWQFGQMSEENGVTPAVVHAQLDIPTDSQVLSVSADNRTLYIHVRLSDGSHAVYEYEAEPLALSRILNLASVQP